jgi:hypothetical protein
VRDHVITCCVAILYPAHFLRKLKLTSLEYIKFEWLGWYLFKENVGL